MVDGKSYAHLTVIPDCLTTCLLYYLPTIWLISATDLESGKLKPQSAIDSELIILTLDINTNYQTLTHEHAGSLGHAVSWVYCTVYAPYPVKRSPDPDLGNLQYAKVSGMHDHASCEPCTTHHELQYLPSWCVCRTFAGRRAVHCTAIICCHLHATRVTQGEKMSSESGAENEGIWRLPMV